MASPTLCCRSSAKISQGRPFGSVAVGSNVACCACFSACLRNTSKYREHRADMFEKIVGSLRFSLVSFRRMVFVSVETYRWAYKLSLFLGQCARNKFQLVGFPLSLTPQTIYFLHNQILLNEKKTMTHTQTSVPTDLTTFKPQLLQKRALR